MIISFNEFKKHLPLTNSPEEIKELLTLKGLEVVDLKEFNPFKPGLVIGEVIKKEKHPNADRLSLTQVKYLSDNQEIIASIVCGAKNFSMGDKVIVATPNTILEGNWKIKKSKIRGAESNGMICSKSELGLEEKSEGIWVLPPSTSLQDDLTDILGEKDFIFDIDLTSNRSDCLSVYGIARELAAIIDQPLNNSEITELQPEIKEEIKIIIKNSIGCPLYCGAIIQGVTIKASPPWLQEKLSKHQVRSINNIVDITNYLLIEYGQPMHAFDQQKIAPAITVRNAQPKEKFVSLENKEYQLTENDLVIADQKKIIGLAGVIGSSNSEIDNKTQNIILEAAYFNPALIRKTSQQHQILSQASYLFSHGIDRNRVLENIKIAINWIKELAGGQGGKINVAGQLTEPPISILVPLTQLNKVLNQSFSPLKIIQYLKRLNFNIIQSNEETITVQPPSFRQDIQHPWDITEEIARLHGYDRFPNQLPVIQNNQYQLEKSHENKIRTLLKGLGYHEIITYPFIENKFVKQVDPHFSNWVIPQNPLLKEISVLRQDLLFGILKTIKLNQERNQKEFNKAFEVGRTFSLANQEYQENEKVAFAGWDYKETFSWHANEVFDFYNLKGDLEELIKHLKLPEIKLVEQAKRYFHPTISYDLFLLEKKIGFIGLVDQEILRYFDIKKKIFFTEFCLTTLNQFSTDKITLKPVSKFPSIYRDLAILIDQEKAIGDITNEIKKNSHLLKNLTLTNVYQGENIPTNKRSLVFHLEFNSYNKTLSREEADKEVEKIVKNIKKNYQFELR